MIVPQSIAFCPVLVKAKYLESSPRLIPSRGRLDAFNTAERTSATHSVANATF